LRDRRRISSKTRDTYYPLVSLSLFLSLSSFLVIYLFLSLSLSLSLSHFYSLRSSFSQSLVHGCCARPIFSSSLLRSTGTADRTMTRIVRYRIAASLSLSLPSPLLSDAIESPIEFSATPASGGGKEDGEQKAWGRSALFFLFFFFLPFQPFRCGSDRALVRTHIWSARIVPRMSLPAVGAGAEGSKVRLAIPTKSGRANRLLAKRAGRWAVLMTR